MVRLHTIKLTDKQLAVLRHSFDYQYNAWFDNSVHTRNKIAGSVLRRKIQDYRFNQLLDKLWGVPPLKVKNDR